MDIVTHGMMGIIVASPFMGDQPVAAGLFMLGSVAPDLDAFSRVLGKRAFLKIHQTYSHAIPVIAAIAGLCWGALKAAGIDAPLGPPALALGMLFHSALDVTNTYGIRILAPFSSRRYCTEWVFFVDAVVVAATIPTLAWVSWRLIETGDAGWKVQAAYSGAMALYWLAKVALRRRAARLGPAGSLALLPSALVPWEYFGCTREGARVRLFRVNALSGALLDDRKVDIHDDVWLDRIRDIPEVRVMRELSPAYHVVAVTQGSDGTELVCRDLRTRNFNTKFGEINLVLDGAGAPRRVVFHV
jgi:membrane-bound metal-dependent hydrolase YbcI (DUF457 family)